MRRLFWSLLVALPATGLALTAAVALVGRVVVRQRRFA